jgi:hypothetical protein
MLAAIGLLIFVKQIPLFLSEIRKSWEIPARRFDEPAGLPPPRGCCLLPPVRSSDPSRCAGLIAASK